MLISEYKNKYKEIVERLGCSPHEFAKAVYFATYFNDKNYNYW